MFRLWSSIADYFGYQQKYKNYYHNLPQNTTLLISFTTSFLFAPKSKDIQAKENVDESLTKSI
jgi:hypothetical protein